MGNICSAAVRGSSRGAESGGGRGGAGERTQGEVFHLRNAKPGWESKARVVCRPAGAEGDVRGEAVSVVIVGKVMSQVLKQ